MFAANPQTLERMHDATFMPEVADRSDVPIIDNVSVDGSVLLAIRHIVEALRGDRGAESAVAATSDT